MIYLFFGLFSCLLNFIALRKQILPDVPNHRSAHSGIASRAGGVIIIINTLLFMSYCYFFLKLDLLEFYNFFFLSVFLINIFGLTDDCKSQSALVKLFMQFCAVIFFVIALINNFPQFTHVWQIYFVLLGFLLFIYSVNAINFMDGINGLIASFFILYIICLFYLNDKDYISYSDLYAKLLIILLISLCTFLCMNLVTKKIFLGDMGSQGVSILLLCLHFSSINSFYFLNFLFVLLILQPLFIDVALTTVKRIYKRKNIFKGHKEHLYQQLFENNFHPLIIIIIYLFFAIINVIAFNFLANNLLLLVGYFVVSSLLLILLWIVFLKVINKTQEIN